MQYLRQSTASQSVLIGPFVDSTDGVTAETGLTINAADIRLSANGGNMAAKNSLGGTHDEAGWYTITLDATDTATVGRLQLSVAVSGALPVFAEFQVLEEAVYDALFASGATGLLPANVTQVAGQTASATGAVNFDDLATVEAKTSQMSFTTGHIHADVGQICSSSIPASNFCADYDGTGYAKANSAIGTANVTGNVSGNVTGIVGGIAGTIQTLDALDIELDAAHGAGSWATATGFVGVAYESVLDDIDGNTQSIPADVVTALGTGSTLSSLATATELAKVPKSDGTATWNATALGSINAQVDAAIETYHLDHLFAVDYDPASPPGTATALLNELIESDGGVSRFTTNALENAPGGAGGVNVTQINGTSITGTGSQVADAFTFFFNVGSAAKTVNDVGVAGSGLTQADVRTAVGLASANLDTQLGNIQSEVNGLDGDSIPSAAAISSQVASDLATAHGAGSWETASGFSTHDAAAVVTALGTGSTLSALATAAELAKVPKSDGAISWNATALASINTQCDTAISDAALATAAELALAKLYSGRLLCIAAGNLSNAQNAAEQYTITLNGVAYTVTAAGLDSDGNRGTTVFAEA
jgi:hypothetical protein